MQYLDEIQTKLNSNKNVFICYRGSRREGGLISQLLYHTILESSYKDIIPFCAPLCNNFENFEIASKNVISRCKVFVAVYTKDFFVADIKDDDQVRKEYVMLAKRIMEADNDIHYVPVLVNIPNKDSFLKKLKRWLSDEENLKLNVKIWKKLYKSDAKSSSSLLKNELLKLVEKVVHCSNECKITFGDRIENQLESIVDTISDKMNERPKIEDGVVWVGPRLSDISGINEDFIKGSISLFGKNDEKKNIYAMCDEKSGIRVDHNNINDKSQDKYIYNQIEKIVKKDNSAKFYFYNQSSLYNIDGLDKLLGNKAICCNAKSVIDCLNNKQSFHNLYKDLNDGKGLLEVVEGSYADCDYKAFCHKFSVNYDDNYKFIMQATVASGGSGTYIMTKKNSDALRNLLSLEHSNNYIYSVFRENNVPVNMHAIIFDDGILFTPGSIQIMKADYTKLDTESDICRLMYRGADFIEYDRLASLENSAENKVNKSQIERFGKLCSQLCEKIKLTGYRGVLGIDGIIYRDDLNNDASEVRILEVNCRFQASSSLINRALKEKGYPSLQEINFAACNGGKFDDYSKFMDGLEVKYSNYSYNYIAENLHVNNVYEHCHECKYVVDVEDDGYSGNSFEDKFYNNTSHLFRVVFNTNICWVNEDGGVNLEELITEPVREFREKITEICKGLREDEKVDPEKLLLLKIALLTQGVKITDEATESLKIKGGLRPATNDAVDICFNKMFYDVVINAPLKNRFQVFCPFTIDTDGDDYALLYYGNFIANIKLYNTDPLEMDGDRRRKTKSGFYYSDVAYLSTDRLRVHVTNECVFKKENKGCRFCNIMPTCGEIDLDAVKDVVSKHWEKRKESGLTHFLIGGQSPEQTEDTINRIADITKIIRDVTRDKNGNSDADIYAMILPREDGLETLRKAGLTQISFNMEIFDDVCAKKYMPGKGSYTRDYYKDCLLKAKEVWRKSANTYTRIDVCRQIRSMIILGLEPDKSFMNGMRWMIDNSIQPIISLFRPLAETPLENFVAPSMIYVFKTYEKIQLEIQEKYKYTRGSDRSFILGPECRCCQNNTLSLPTEIFYEVKK